MAAAAGVDQSATLEGIAAPPAARLADDLACLWRAARHADVIGSAANLEKGKSGRFEPPGSTATAAARVAADADGDAVAADCLVEVRYSIDGAARAHTSHASASGAPDGWRTRTHITHLRHQGRLASLAHR